MTPAIELVDVRKSFGPTQIIRGVSLAIEAGTRQAVIGPNGAGKSTLFNLITGKYPVSAGGIRLKGESITGLRPYEINRRGLSRSFQVTNIFPWLSVFENVRCSVLWSMGYRYSFWHLLDNAADVRARAEVVLEQLNLTARRHVPAGMLSYAEQRALEIGITIAGGADVILLDEPTSGMSRSETEQVVQLIREVTAGKTLLMVEHDMSVVFDLADRIAVLVYGEVIAHDTPERIRANAAVQEAYLGVLQVNGGEIVSLLGRNGVGRSTTVKAIMGDVRAHGSVRFRDEEMCGLPPYVIARKGLGYVPENRDIFPTLTVRENLLLGMKSARRPGRWSIEDMFTLFPSLRERADNPGAVLSGGEQQMLTMCRTLMGDPHLIMIDEPTEGLAPLLVKQVSNLLVEIAQRGIAILLVEQKLTIALTISSRVYVMGHGRVVFQGSPADLAANESVRKEWLEV
jgi:branched-chain amino acid transport system ATP-binding protein